MDYLQYTLKTKVIKMDILGFKPCYKWITFNTYGGIRNVKRKRWVLNLVINGLPSIQKDVCILCALNN